MFPLTLIGESIGNSSFDLADANMDQVRCVHIVYLTGEEVELDAVVAKYYNRPPQPTLETPNWRIPY